MKKAIAAVIALVAVHELLARALDRVDWIERLLAPGPDVLVAIPFALVLYALRLALVFVVPAAFATIALRALVRRSEPS